MLGTLPTLTINGFVNNKRIQVQKLFEYFLASDKSQSTLFNGKVASLKYILATYDNVADIRSNLREALYNLYSVYFDSTEVKIDIEDKDDSGNIDIYINVTVVDEGTTYTLNKLLNYENGGIQGFQSMLDKYYDIYYGINMDN